MTCSATFESHDQWPRAEANEQIVLITAGLLYLVVAGRTVYRDRPGWFPFWLVGLAAWATVPKYLLCTRCENYGKPCDFTYGGKYAAMLFEQHSGKAVGWAGIIAEGASLATFMLLPVAASLRHPRSLIRYALAGILFQSILIRVCCIACVERATDPWKKKYCPTYKLVEGLGLAGPDPGAARL